ncbi:hypothetical protein [Actinoallomurus iriomotensis]|uniref:Uncharacterized protein n=1 Tax=Actinoallomurus iriomotensis TaxID=478107 RepID=A0A9W6SC19_9ACTN|nr:hypothetical protein [Actinoallomurus iriomotensis]GLY89822.1 hypothetical protein Airi02_077510 [Actinoallomurus iriomotensis]
MKTLIAAAAAFVLVVAAAIVFLLNRHTDSGPDAFPGAYPLVTANPTGVPALTWRPTGTPAGPLPTFPGAGSRTAGTITDRQSGISYALLGSPWARLTSRLSVNHTSGEEVNSRRKDYKHFWYAAVYVGPLDPKLAVAGSQRLRAAAELTGKEFVDELYSDDGQRKDLAGAPMTVDHRNAWVTAFRMTHTASDRLQKGQTEVIVAVDTGRRMPAIVEITIPSNQPNLLPDINHVVRSLHVVR